MTLFRTPVASEADGGARNTLRSRSTMRLSDQVQEAMFPTPKASDGVWGTPRTSGRPIDKATHLATIASLLPTLRASDGEKGGPNQRGSRGDLTMSSAVQLLPTITTQDAKNTGGDSQHRRNTPALNAEVTLFPTPRAHDYAASMGSPGAARHVASGNGSLAEVIGVHLEPLPASGSVAEYEALWAALDDQSPFWATDKGVDYWPAISRWADVMGRKSPSPTVPDGRGGRHRLNPAFAEWLMGLPAGWADGLTRNERLKGFGNGVVPQQAFAALSAAAGRF